MTPTATRKILASSSIPNHRMTSGIIARCGTLRSIWTGLSISFSATGKAPVTTPSAKPIPPPMASPIIARWKLIQTWWSSTPEISASHPATAMALGAGSNRADRIPLSAAASQTITRPTGTIQGARVSNARTFFQETFMVGPLSAGGGAGLRRHFVGDHFAERAGVADRPAFPAGGGLQGHAGEHQFGEPVSLLQMRIAGQDELLDPEVHVLLDAI